MSRASELADNLEVVHKNTWCNNVEMDAAAELRRLDRVNAELVEALEKIERWFGEFPSTGEFWKDGTEISYAAQYGSNGERDFMRSIARAALTSATKETK